MTAATRPPSVPRRNAPSAGSGRRRPTLESSRAPGHPTPPGSDAEPPLVTAVAEATRAANMADFALVGSLLEPHLRVLDPGTAADSPVLIEAAMLWHLAHAVADPGWIRYAYDAGRRFHGDDHRLTLAAGGALAAALARHGDRGAVEVYRAVVSGYTRRADGDAAIRARTGLAGVLHRRGDCDAAIGEARQACDEWRRTQDLDAPGGLLAAVALIAILSACGRHPQALVVLAQTGPALPPSGSPERAEFARWAATAMEVARDGHAPRCARRHVTATPAAGRQAPPRPCPPIDWHAYLQ